MLVACGLVAHLRGGYRVLILAQVLLRSEGCCPPASSPAPPADDTLQQLKSLYDYLNGYRYGPDRALYLPGGLLDRSEVPAYLNGTLPGE